MTGLSLSFLVLSFSQAAPDKQLDVVTKSPDRDPFADPSPEAEEDPEEALDIADQLLATLDARDAAAVSETANLPGATAHKVAHNSSTSVGSSGSGKDSLGKGNRRGHSGSGDLLDGVRSAGHELKHAGGRLLSGLAHPGHGQGHNSGNVQGAPTAPASAPAGLESEPSRRSSMRRSLFGHSPKAKDDRLAAVETAQGTDAGESGTETAGSDGKKKVSRQKARKVRVIIYHMLLVCEMDREPRWQHALGTQEKRGHHRIASEEGPAIRCTRAHRRMCYGQTTG